MRTPRKRSTPKELDDSDYARVARHLEVSRLQIHDQPDGRVVLEATVLADGQRPRQMLVRLAKHVYADMEFALLQHYEGYLKLTRAQKRKPNPNFPVWEKARRP